MLKVCSYLMLLCLLEINGQQDKWSWSTKTRNTPGNNNNNQRENRKYERLEDLRDRYEVSESSTKKPFTQNDDFYNGANGFGGPGGPNGPVGPIAGNTNRYNVNGFGGYTPQGFGNGIGGPNQLGGPGQFGNQYPGQFGPNNGINQFAGNGYYPQYANGGGLGGTGFGNGVLGNGGLGNGGLGNGGLVNGGLGNGGSGNGGLGGGFPNNPYYQNGYYSNGGNGGFGPNRHQYNPLGNSAANGILVGPGGPTGQYGRPFPLGFDNGLYNRPGFTGNGIGPGQFANAGIPGGFGNGPIGAGNGFGGRPFGYGGPYDQTIPFSSKSGAGIQADESEDSKDRSHKGDSKNVN